MAKKKSDKSTENIISDKIIRFDSTGELLPEIAEDLFDEGDVETSLATFLRIDDQEKDFDILRKIADLYTELGMYDYAINYWFRFIDKAPARYHAEAYNGLGGNYYMMHKNELAAYYFNLQINDKNDSEFPFDDMMYELFDNKISFSVDKHAIRIYNSQNEKDAKMIDIACAQLESDPNSARKILKEIAETSSSYGDARFYLGVLDMMDLNLSESLKNMLIAKRLKIKENVSNSYIYGLSFYLNKTEIMESAYIDMKKGVLDFDASIAFFPLFTGYGKMKTAYRYAVAIEGIFCDFGKMNYYYALAAFNDKKYSDAIAHLRNYYSITNVPHVFALLNNFNAVSKHTTEFTPCEYIETMQNYLIEHSALLLDVINEKPSLLQKEDFVALYPEIESCLYSDNVELCGGALHAYRVINDGVSLNILKKFLLRDDANDFLKPFAISLFIEVGYEEPVGLVFNHIYSKVPFEHVEFNDVCGDFFRSAYALAFGRFVPYYEKEVYKLRISAYSLYEKFLASGNIRKVKNLYALAALIAKNSGINLPKDFNEICVYMGTTASAVCKLENLLGE